MKTKIALLLTTLTIILGSSAFASEYNCKELNGKKLTAYLVFDDSVGSLDYSNVQLDGKVFTEGDYDVIYSSDDTVNPKMTVHLKLAGERRLDAHTLVCKQK